jgi:hypothetical protein
MSAAQNYESFIRSLKNIAASLSLPGMSTLASKPVADAVDVECTDDERLLRSSMVAAFPPRWRGSRAFFAPRRNNAPTGGLSAEVSEFTGRMWTKIFPFVLFSLREGALPADHLVSSMASHEGGFTGAKTTRRVFPM